MKKILIWCAICFLVINTGCSITTRDTLTTRDALTPGNVHLRLGNPSGANASNPNNYLMIKSQYALSYNRDKGIPNWVSWQLNKSWLGSTDRTNDFRPDPKLPNGWYRVTGREYRDSGYDRGHMVPSADRTNNQENNSATFLMTNIIPQFPDNNREYWREFEEYTRKLVRKGNELYIIAGGYGGNKKIAKGKISIPARLYKIIAVTKPGSKGNDIQQVIAIDTPNLKGEGNWQDFITTVDAIEKKTGYDFLSNVNKSVQKVIEGKKYSVKGNSNRSRKAKRSGKCHPAYPNICIPAPPPYLNCKDIPYKKFKVLPPDPHNFDGNKDGVACEK
ncbi:MAG: DNA/RNA non-specific endonuclease [Calothrix sp. MO_192.B10]|nr:DNA/RNA non-specific endonuclease [Calothrix sp. MO_192.B10]